MHDQNVPLNKGGNSLRPRALVITAIVVAAAALRIAPHPMNFAPIGALASIVNVTLSLIAEFPSIDSLSAGWSTFCSIHRSGRRRINADQSS